MQLERSHHFLFRFVVLLFLVLLLLCFSIPNSAYAAATEYNAGEETITLTGEYDGLFTLDSDSSELFRLVNAIPGDSWIGRIKIENKAPAKMEVALLSIENELKDDLLFNVLKLDIKSGKEFIYSGSYGETEEPITGFYTLKPGESMYIDVRVSLPSSAGNEVQNREMDSKWIFEARYYGQVSPQTGDDITTRTVRDGTLLWIAILSFIAVAVVGLRISAVKREFIKREGKKNNYEKRH